MTDSSDIDKLIEDMNTNQLNQNENATVNSILQELNGDNTQQTKPQITDEEKEMLMKQQMQQAANALMELTTVFFYRI